MNREHQPCGMCNRFPPAKAKDEGVERAGYCSGWEKQVLSTDQPCVLFLERGTWETRRAEQTISRDQFPRNINAQPPRPARARTTTGAT